jgi:hypothetical protein
MMTGLTFDPSQMGRRGGAMANTHFGQEIRDIVFYRLLGKKELVCDLSVRFPGGNLLQDGAFAIGQPSKQRITTAVVPLKCGSVSEHGLSCGYALDVVEQIEVMDPLEHESRHAFGSGCLERRLIGKSGQNEDSRARRKLARGPADVDSRPIGKVEVNDYHIRFVNRDSANRVGNGRCLCDNLKVRLGFDQSA